MSSNKTIDSFEDKGIQFDDIEYLIEFFSAPLPASINGSPIDTKEDLIRMSGDEGYKEFFMTDKDAVHGTSGGIDYEFSRDEFLRWQLSKLNSATIFQLAAKTNANLAELLDFDEESESDPNYDPEGWLNPYFDDSDNRLKGLQFIERLREQEPERFYEVMINGVLDEHDGLLNHLETEVYDDLNHVRDLYSHWDVPLTIVSKGRFSPYIEPGFCENFLMDEYELGEMYVANNDEGDIDS